MAIGGFDNSFMEQARIAGLANTGTGSIGGGLWENIRFNEGQNRFIRENSPFALQAQKQSQGNALLNSLMGKRSPLSSPQISQLPQLNTSPGTRDAIPLPGVPGSVPLPSSGGLDFKSLLQEILGPIMASLEPQEAAARQRLEDSFRLAGGGAGPGSLQGPLLESIRRQEEGFGRERGLVGSQAALGLLNPFLGTSTAIRGQDIAARGQDIQRELGFLNPAVTARGQDIGAQSALLQTLLSSFLA